MQFSNPLLRRFVAAIALAVVWSTVSLAGLDLVWVLVGAGCIGILATVGAEPPRRKRLRRVPAPATARV